MEAKKATPGGAQAQTKHKHGKAFWGKAQNQEGGGRLGPGQHRGRGHPRVACPPAPREKLEQAATGGGWGDRCRACEREQVKVLNVPEASRALLRETGTDGESEHRPEEAAHRGQTERPARARGSWPLSEASRGQQRKEV